MKHTFRNQLNKFNRTNLYLYKVVTAQEVDYAARFWEVNLSKDKYEIVCDFIYDWFTSTDADIPEICEHFFSELTQGKFKLSDITKNYEKVENIINNSF